MTSNSVKKALTAQSVAQSTCFRQEGWLMDDVLGRKAPWLDNLTCNHFHVERLRAPQVLCLSAPVLSPCLPFFALAWVTHISRVRSEQAHLNPSASLG